MSEKPKKKNPQDATLRNINALKKRVTELETKVSMLIGCWKFLELTKGKLK